MPINTVNDVDDLAMKGIVAVPLRFRKRSSGKISYTPGECRKWHPLMTGDYGPKDDDD